MSHSRYIFITALALLLSILFFGFSHIDFTIQDKFYNFKTASWLLDKHRQPYAFIFYTGLKILLISVAVLFLGLFIFFRKHPIVRSYKKGIIIVILSAMIVPLVTVKVKNYTNMPCPKNEIHYGGNYPHTAVWEHYKAPYTNLEIIKCWPAGHASGGFALMALFFLFKRKRYQYVALSVALILGWSMGFYKMFIGDHFFSHTFISMLLAWLLILIISKIVNRL